MTHTQSASTRRAKKGRFARAYARREIKVFPLHSIDTNGVCTCGGPEVNPKCKPGKHPRTKRGFKAATTDERKISEWWNHWPDANIGMPTGERSGIWVVDVDPRHGGEETIKCLERELGPLTTLRQRTGGGGTQHFLEWPEGGGIRNSAGKLGDGIDVRGEGGYVVLPPSTTRDTYKWLGREKPTAAPSTWVEAARPTSSSGRSSDAQARIKKSFYVDDGEPIPEGTRNDTLARIAGRRHDGRPLEDLASDLLAVNAARCSPPLPEDEVLAITASIHRRTPCRKTRGPDEDALDVLDAVEDRIRNARWVGMAGKTMYSVMIILLKTGRQHSKPQGAGVRASISVRALALEVGVSKKTLNKAIRNLIDAGWLRRDNVGRSGTKSGAFVLLPTRAKVTHSKPGWGEPEEKEERRHVIEEEHANVASGLPSRSPYSAPRLRWSSPGGRPRRGLVHETRRPRQGPPPEARPPVKRIGKSVEPVIDYLEAVGGSATIKELAAGLHVPRARDLKRRDRGPISKLEKAGVVECSEEGVVNLTRDWLEALNHEREITGEIEARRQDVADYNRERQAYQNRQQNQPQFTPTRKQMEEQRESYPERRRKAIQTAMAALFEERPEYRRMRAGQIACRLPWYLPKDFSRSNPAMGYADAGPPKDAEVEAILDGAEPAAA